MVFLVRELYGLAYVAPGYLDWKGSGRTRSYYQPAQLQEGVAQSVAFLSVS
jgi:hypothetical protein